MILLKLFIILTLCNGLVLSLPLKNTYRRDKIRSRTLRVPMRQNEPFINRNDYGDLKKGIEFELMKIIAEKEELKLFIKRPLRNPDILVGGLFPNLTSLKKFEFSTHYYQDDLTWCIQRAKFFSFLLNAFLMADPECWLIIIFVVGYGLGSLLYIGIQFDVNYEQRNKRDWHYATLIIMLPAVIGMNQRYTPGFFSLKIMYFIIIMACVVHFQIFFFHGNRFLKIPVRHSQKSTVNEIIELDYRLSGSTEVLSMIKFDERYKRTQIDDYHICKDIDVCLELLKHDDNEYLAVGGSRQRILNSPSYLSTEIFCFDIGESIVSYQPRLLFRKNFRLKSRVNKIIRNAFESGLFIKWDRDNRKKPERLVKYEPPMAITLEHYTGFVLLFFLNALLVCISTFIAEQYVCLKRKQNPQSKQWKRIETFFDGKRYYLKDLSK